MGILKVFLAEKVIGKTKSGWKFNPGWKRAVAKGRDGKVVWFYISICSQPSYPPAGKNKKVLFDVLFNSDKERFSNQYTLIFFPLFPE